MKNIIVLTAAALLSIPVAASAKDRTPNMVGVWTGLTHTIVAGEGGNWTGHPGTFSKPALFERLLTFEILGQDGRRFWGRSMVQGSSVPAEPFIGSLRVDGRGFLISDTDGSFSGSLTGKNTLEYCYVTVPGAVTKAAIVGCSSLKREN